MKPKVTLMSWSNKPIETVYALWEASKNEDPLLDVNQVNIKDALPVFKKVIAQNIPVGEHISFVFMLENVSVSFREQMVRHRIGTKVGDNIGVDIVPDLHTSTFWSQSMRIQGMGKFADYGAYRIPDGLTRRQKQEWDADMLEAQDRYNNWKTRIPIEDAREMIPLGAQHRISWALNLCSIQHIMGKRSCWILQAGLWFPIIHGIINELATKIHPAFRDIAQPPCMDNSCFKTCVYKLENERRVDGSDCHHACPLYLQENHKPYPMEDVGEFHERKELYGEMWGIEL